MTQHVDPASLAFLALSSREQAQVYLSRGWSVDAIADELGVTEALAEKWVTDGRLPSGRAGGADAPQPAPRSSPDGRSSLTQEGEA